MSSRPAWTDDETPPLKMTKWGIFPCQSKVVQILVHQPENSGWSFCLLSSAIPECQLCLWKMQNLTFHHPAKA